MIIQETIRFLEEIDCIEGIQIMSRRYLFGKNEVIDRMVSKCMCGDISHEIRAQVVLTICNQIK